MMNDERWTAVDSYFAERLLGADTILDAALQAQSEAGLPAIHVAPNQGALLNILAQTLGARAILEIGALGGYSTIWLARALAPGGRLVSLELDPRHAEVARANLANAGLAAVAEVRQGQAIKLLPELEAEGVGPFDLVFIDADKQSTADYFAWALRLTRPGSLIVVDNVVRGGEVADPSSSNSSVLGVRRFADVLANEPRVKATAMQTVGEKGYDGLIIALVLAAKA
jgi:predicted O-methyltransferase YrrM